MVQAVSDPEAARLLAEASLTGFELVKYMLQCESKASSEVVAEKVLRYQAQAVADHAGPGEYQVAVTPEQVLLFAQLASMASASFAAMCQVRAGRLMSKEELSAQLAQYQETLLLGGSL